jgi:fluoride exporter
VIVAVAVVALSGVGSVARFVLDRVVQHRVGSVFPAGTFAVNTAAAFAIGIVAGFAAHHGAPSTAVKLSAIGFLGGFSTFSTWAFETLTLGESGALLEAAINVAGTFVLGLVFAAAGYGIASL